MKASTKSLLSLGLFVAVGSLALTGCGSQGPAGPKLTGAISGFVTLVNADGSQPADRSGVAVTLEGLSSTATTDVNGFWSIPNLETGIYTIDYNKAGYGSSKTVQTQFIGGGPKEIGTVDLCAAPGFYIGNFWNKHKANDSINIYLAFKVSDSTVTGSGRVFIFCGLDSTVSFHPQTYHSLITATPTYTGGVDSTFNTKVTPAAWTNNGFTNGETIYLAAYTANAGTTNSGYIDLATGRTIYTNIDTTRSNVVAIIIP
ncbi:MAG: carboxypeptidase-like regulatory domain-containing protein [Chitinivibrionales bacterium]|nr:carboxypeptidase-like regulatory domain-containing protein [Chitinivibrionales bacterium]